jgi:ribosomal protein S13
MSQRLLARLQIHNEALVSNLTEPQVTALSAYLSSPTTNPSPNLTPVCPPGQQPSSNKGKGRETETRQDDPLDILKIETDLRRSLQSDIAHHRTIGTYRGKRLVLVFDEKTGELHLRLTVQYYNHADTLPVCLSEVNEQEPMRRQPKSSTGLTEEDLLRECNFTLESGCFVIGLIRSWSI